MKNLKNSLLRFSRLLCGLGTIALFFAQASCVEYKNIVNFRSAPDSLATKSIPLPTIPEHHILPDDQLSITIYSLDPAAVAPLNLNSVAGSSSFSPTGQTEAPIVGAGYLVDREGYIEMPVIGKLKAGGLSVQQLKDTISQKALRYVNDPIVNIRYLNFRFTVLGEVTRPGTFVVANENVTLLQALGMAGDFTNYSNRANVLVVREQDGQQVFQYLNLQSQDIFRSPYFYLQKNDLVYVEPMSQKTASIADPATKILPYVSVLITLATLTVTILRT